MSSQDFETTVATLASIDESTIAEGNEVIVRRASGLLSTGGQAPTDAESDPENPVPVEGYAPELEAEGDLWIEGWTPEQGASPNYEAPEVIIGTDDRVRVANPRAWPYCVHGHLTMRFPNGRTFIGSGTMVNRHHVLTAGHCVFSRANGGWATAVTFEAARNDASRPFGTVSAVRLLSVTGWTQNNDQNFDMGMLVLGAEIGRQTGWLGVITGPDGILLRHRVNVTGYPGDKGGNQMWTMADVIKSVQSERFFYDIDTMGGQSGSGVWSGWQGHSGEKVAGIHTTGASSGNGATRISRPKFDRIVDWMANF